MDDFLYSNNIDIKEKTYKTILENRQLYSGLILKELEKYAEDHTITENIPNELIYIASIFRDKTYLPSLVKIIQFREYSENSCIYNCPIVFSLTLYECFSEFSVPPNLNKQITPVFDLYSDVKFAEAKSFLEDTTIHILSQRMREIYNETKKLNVVQLVQQAGPKNNYYISRFVAINMLANKINDEKYLYDLYWLAITEAEDASGQYRSEIYKAILKAEYYKSKKIKNRTPPSTMTGR